MSKLRNKRYYNHDINLNQSGQEQNPAASYRVTRKSGALLENPILSDTGLPNICADSFRCSDVSQRGIQPWRVGGSTCVGGLRGRQDATRMQCLGSGVGIAYVKSGLLLLHAFFVVASPLISVGGLASIRGWGGGCLLNQ